MTSPEQKLIEGIRQGDIGVFEEIYKKYYTFLCLIAEFIIRNPSDAEEIVSDVFVRIWNMRGKIQINTSLKAYLIKAVQNTPLNYLERTKLINRSTERLSDANAYSLVWDSNYPLGQLYEKETIEIIENCVKSLPEGCREVFQLSRDKDYTYLEIACKLGISVNTVKTQMKIALSRLRESLEKYLVL